MKTHVPVAMQVELLLVVLLLVFVTSRRPAEEFPLKRISNDGEDTTSIGRDTSSSRGSLRFCVSCNGSSRKCSISSSDVNESVDENQVSESCEHKSNCQRSDDSVVIMDLQKDKYHREGKLEGYKPISCSAGYLTHNSESGSSLDPYKPGSTTLKGILTIAVFMCQASRMLVLLKSLDLYLYLQILMCNENDSSTVAILRCKRVQHKTHLDKDKTQEKTRKLHQIMRHQNSFKSNTNVRSWKAWRFMFEFTQKWRVTLTAFPFTLNQLVQEIVQDSREPSQLMRYEWQRYLSFQTFPQESPVMPMRLAQAGFYYTGQGQEVRCFSCDAQNSIWSTEETPLQVHRRISPGCPFIQGESTDNVTIHGQDYYANMDQ